MSAVEAIANLLKLLLSLLKVVFGVGGLVGPWGLLGVVLAVAVLVWGLARRGQPVAGAESPAKE